MDSIDTIKTELDSMTLNQITDTAVNETLKTINGIDNPAIQLMILVILGFAGLSAFIAWRMYSDNKDLMTNATMKIDRIDNQIPVIMANQESTKKYVEKLHEDFQKQQDNLNEIDKRVIKLELKHGV